MKSTKTLLAVVVVVGGIASCGCGSDVAGGVSLADAFDECNLFEMLDTGEPLSDGLFNAVVILAEAFRDDGGSKSFYIIEGIDTCGEPEVAGTDAARTQCVVCITAIAAVVWP